MADILHYPYGNVGKVIRLGDFERKTDISTQHEATAYFSACLFIEPERLNKPIPYVGLLCTSMIENCPIIGHMDAYELAPMLAFCIANNMGHIHNPIRFQEQVYHIGNAVLQSVVESCGDVHFAKHLWKTYRHEALGRSLDVLLEKEACMRHLSSKARVIQSKWRRAISDPCHPICRRRLQREFTDLQE